MTGNETGAVFTFAMGYNVTWSRWLAGIQSEVSLNRNNIRLQGTGQDSGTQTNVFTGLAPFFGPNGFTQIQTSSNSNNSAVFNNLENKWTISKLARIGYLLAPDWLVYGLVGWSWGGFEAFQGNQPFTLNGFTYGAGVEKDFGWLRAFVQYKGINYGSKNINESSPSSFQNTQTFQGFVSSTSSGTTTDSAVRRYSADVQQITAGITVPINFNRW